MCDDGKGIGGEASHDGNKATRAPWLTLPEDVMFEILHRVGPTETTNSASLVCRTWKTHSRAATLWKAFTREDYATFYNGLTDPHSPQDWNATYQYLFDLTENSPRQVLLDLGSISNAGELEPHHIRRLLNICRAICRPDWFDRVGSGSVNLKDLTCRNIYKAFFDILRNEEMGLVRIKSRRVYNAVFEAAVQAVGYLGLVEPGYIELDDEYSFSSMRTKFERVNTFKYARVEILNSVAIFAMVVLILFSPLTGVAKSLICSAILSPLVALAPVEFSWLTLYRAVLPLIFCDLSVNSHSKIASCIAYGAMQLSGPLLKTTYPWFVSVMFALGWAVRTWTNLESDLAANHMGHYVLFRGVVGGLMTCQMLGFCFDASKRFSLTTRDFISARPRLASVVISGIQLANRYVRLGFSWALTAGNLTWASFVPAETRERRYHNDNNYLFPVYRRKRTKTFVAITSSVFGGLFALAAFIQQKYGFML